MFKVSFKDTPNKPYKKVEYFQNRVTVVTLTGTITNKELIPFDILMKIKDKGFDFYYNACQITVQGKAICHNTDTFDPVIGERVAESKAKIKLYKRMKHLMRDIALYHEQAAYSPAKAFEKYSELLHKEQEHFYRLIV